ncbi:unnamed protein product [Linum tenue]|uniref:ADP-ribosyl cyclase/cyclic ADP-ribose hydrolase n=1 Tax=Linum tenue TaxID=586396 RepID=A0AAV0S4W7_9ROSI|nr:unnamed protein product [Linum tenue]
MALSTKTTSVATAALFLLLLHSLALCGAGPHGRFGHSGSITQQPNYHHRPPWRPDVFLNFRGPDVRHTFSDHLYHALVRRGIKAFRDDRDLPRGVNVTEAIPRAIEESRLSVVVLSRGYASSEYCLDELVKIMLNMKERGHRPFPVFYNLSPDDVADHRSSASHKRRYSYERVEGWSHALTSIAQISGWVLSTDR